MTREEVLTKLCGMMGKVWDAIDPFAHNPCDCICRNKLNHYQNSGEALEFMQKAIDKAIAEYAAASPSASTPQDVFRASYPSSEGCADPDSLATGASPEEDKPQPQTAISGSGDGGERPALPRPSEAWPFKTPKVAVCPKHGTRPDDDEPCWMCENHADEPRTNDTLPRVPRLAEDEAYEREYSDPPTDYPLSRDPNGAPDTVHVVWIKQIDGKDWCPGADAFETAALAQANVDGCRPKECRVAIYRRVSESEMLPPGDWPKETETAPPIFRRIAEMCVKRWPGVEGIDLEWDEMMREARALLTGSETP